MEEKLSLNSSLYAEATPAGAYFAVASSSSDSARKLLAHVLKEGGQAPLTGPKLFEWSGADSQSQALQLLYRLQRLQFVQGTNVPRKPPDGNLESILPGLLGKISDTGRALLADSNGFYIACAGFRHESAEEIAALAGDVLALGDRHALLLQRNLNIKSSAWAIVDPAGRSELGFFPLYIGDQTFMLVLGGTPLIQSEDFVVLIESLSRRYT